VECLYLGPIFANFASLKPRERYQKYLECETLVHKYLIGRLHANSIKIRSSTGFEDPRGFAWNGYQIEPRFTYILNLKEGKDSIWKNFRKTLRNSIDKTQRLGIEVTGGSEGDLVPLYHLMKNRRRIETSIEFLRDIFTHFHPTHVRMFKATLDGNFLSAVLVTIFRNRVSFWVGAPRVSIQGTSPNEFILWNIIQWAIDQKFEFFEIIGADDPSLFPFKNKFNAELNPGYWARWDSPIFRTFMLFRDMIKQD
jgi:lipid II:glycine glycyltransferase (peptidoglycan interpeptide bridge formation enzyme)